jgi:hypothetical protein
VTIALEPPLAGGFPAIRSEPLREAPRFMRGPGNGRWHIPRSGQRHGLGHTTYAVWCGQTLFDSDRRPRKGARPGPLLGRDDWPDDGAPVCGTCAGRAVGADRDVDELLFAPRRLDPPAWCPGADIGDLWVMVPGQRNLAVCLACDAVAKLRGGSRGYGWTSVRTAPHPPEELVPPCPFHGWRNLRPDGTGSSACPCGADPW